MEVTLTKFIGKTGMLVLCIVASNLHYCQPSPISDANTTNTLCSDDMAFHNDTSTCYNILEKGPCGELQLFYRLSQDSQYGSCGCMSNSDGCSQSVKVNRMILSSADGRQCYYAYSQGPCSIGQWYVLNVNSLKPECQQDPCSSSIPSKQPADPLVGADEEVLGIGPGGSDKFTFVQNNTCYKTYTQAYCPDGKYVQFLGTNDPSPKCYLVTMGPPMCLFGAGPTAGMPCPAGYKLVGDGCTQFADFE